MRFKTGDYIYDKKDEKAFVIIQTDYDGYERLQLSHPLAGKCLQDGEVYFLPIGKLTDGTLQKITKEEAILFTI